VLLLGTQVESKHVAEVKLPYQVEALA
jgi:hypothetical protein